MAHERGGAAAFGRWTRRVARKETPKRQAQIHQKLHIQLADGLIADSPVGNPSLWKSPPPPNYAGGRFKGNWQSSIGQPAQGETGRIDPGGSATRAENQQLALRIGAYVRSDLVNNSAYGPRLNQDPPHTKQIAPGWVQRNLQRVRVQFSSPFRRGR